MQRDAQAKLAKDRARIWQQLDENLSQYKEGLKRENEKASRANEGQESEKSNKETLEMMSKMAQKIDEDN